MGASDMESEHEKSSVELEVAHYRWNGDDRVDDNTDFVLQQQNNTVGRLLESDLPSQRGVHLVFMPTIEKQLEVKVVPKLAKRIENQFHLPPFFLKKIGWNANGFYGSLLDPVPDHTGNTYNIFMRFLSKQVSTPKHDPEGKIEYDWTFMGFYVLWQPPQTMNVPRVTDTSSTGGDNDGVRAGNLILLCFDLDSRLQRDIKQSISLALRQTHSRSHLLTPFDMLRPACQVIIEVFDGALWSYQKPVRDIEKSRFKFAEENVGSLRELDQRYEDILHKLDGRYEAIHELLRHTIHISEVLAVAARTVNALLTDMTNFSTLKHEMQVRADHSARQNSQYLSWCSGKMTNFTDRAQAFVDRLHNEAQLVAFNVVAAYDAKVSTSILEQTRSENKSLVDTVSILTVLFLPSTFISGFFGMNFFTLEVNATSEVTRWRWSKTMWIFFACAVPLTVLGLFLVILELNIIGWTRKHIKGRLKRGSPKISIEALSE